MQIQINTDRNIEGREALAAWVRSEVEDALDRYRAQISRIEVHLSDENAGKNGQRDMRCMIEARLEGRQPIAVTEEAASKAQAVQGATGKLTRLIAAQLGRVARSDRSPDKPALD
ncbi:MAG: HPF/RaiA family ribosome-associated protein [Rubrivivax sp.]|nr:HPF/RaiA family ribosome-associated protein [Rubrivivax sp.]